MKNLLTTLLFLSLLVANAQDYLFPINPGHQGYISGTMGELRANHFHAGLDIKTGGHTGVPVHATEDGFITRIKIEEGGYGNALYMYHPSTGHTSVYAHLETFSERIADYTRQNQYKEKSFTIELYPQKADFQIKRGDVIAYSGNTGGSGGPHLHFEIRNKEQDLVNPLNFHFKEVHDNIAPSIYEIILTTKGINSRINNEFGKIPFTPHHTNGDNYVIHTPIEVKGQFTIALETIDKLNGSSNKNGTNYIKLLVDDKLIFQYANNSFSFSKTRFINTHFDYELADRGLGRFHNLYRADGNSLPLYPVVVNDGVITINDTLEHTITIACTDAVGNTSTLNFTAIGVKNTDSEVLHSAKMHDPFTASVIENTLKITTHHRTHEIQIDNLTHQPNYHLKNASVYLYDLKRSTPDSITINNIAYPLHFIQSVKPNEKTRIYSSTADFHFPPGALYDTTYFQYHLENDTFYIHNTSVPLHKYINITLKADTGNYKSKTHAYSKNRDGYISYEGGVWGTSGIWFKTRSFGRYFLQTDTIPPVVKYHHKEDGEVYFKISDAMSGIRSYNAYMNSDWLLMHYDYKRNLIWSERLDKTKELSGLLKIAVTDNAGNTEIFELEL